MKKGLWWISLRSKLHRFKNRCLRAQNRFVWDIKNLKSLWYFSIAFHLPLRLEHFERKVFSQNGEDGVLQAIFKALKISSGFAVEFGIHPKQGNSIWLAKKGWNTLWMDGNGDGSTIKKEYITAENIEQLLKKYQVPQEFDLLSIDIDSNDYWVWRSIQSFHPKVVVLEYNSSIPVDQAKTIPYDPTYIWDRSNYFGASLLAMNKLADQKGYTLVYCDSIGANAFFIRNDLMQGKFVHQPIEQIFRPPKYGIKQGGVYLGHPFSSKPMLDV